jgi:deoxyribodipyrimidine photo-lyase
MLWGHTLFHVNDLPFSHTQTPDVYTQFRKKCEKSLVRQLFETPKSIKTLDGWVTKIPAIEVLGFENPPISDKSVLPFKGGEEEACKRLQHYFWESKKISAYKKTRNSLLGADYASKFSHWLAQGCISPRSLYYEVQKYEKEITKNQSTYWLVFELIWRDYFRYVAVKYGDRLLYDGGIHDEKMEWEPNDEYLQAWKSGETGIPFIDANMKELNQTGFMINWGRQNVAIFLVKDLKEDLRKRAAYFEQQIIYYNVTSNWGNWIYVSGVEVTPANTGTSTL